MALWKFLKTFFLEYSMDRILDGHPKTYNKWPIFDSRVWTNKSTLDIVQ